ncbi:hypothetical protein BGW42_006474, partial [Actinomortierella wolfii]
MGSRKESKKTSAHASKREANGDIKHSTEPQTSPRKRLKVDSVKDTNDTTETRTIENDQHYDEDNDQDILPLDDPYDDTDQAQDSKQDEEDEDEDFDMGIRSTPTQSKAHTSDRVRKIDTNPEVEAAFRERYMTQFTQAFGDELNTLREQIADEMVQQQQQQYDEQQPILEHNSPNVAVNNSLTQSSPLPSKLSIHEPRPTTPRHWLVLSMACLLLAGNYYCYDLPAALSIQLKEWLGTDDATHQYQLNLLYSAYSLPNIVLPLAGGFLVDRLSASKMIIVFSLCICTGQSLFIIGLVTRSFWTMVLGRFLFGIGGECLEVAQCKVTTDWFKHAWLGLALGLNLSSARIATALNDNISPWIALRFQHGVVVSSVSGLFICLISFLCGIGLATLDRSESRILAGVKPDAPKNAAQLCREERYQEQRHLPEERGVRDNGVGNSANDDASDDDATEVMLAEDDKMLVSEVWTLQPSFWILCLCCITLYGTVVPFFHILSGFLQARWYHNDPQRAGTVMSLPDVISAVGSPLCGFLVDRFGHRSRYIPPSAVLLIWSHAQLGFSTVTPILGMSIMGVAYSLFASVLWPCIPFLVEDEQLGTAYGIVTIALNISLTVFPIVVAWLLHQSGGNYQVVEEFFITLAVLGLMLSILLNALDERCIAMPFLSEGEEYGEESPLLSSAHERLLAPPATVAAAPPHPLQGDFPEGRPMLPSEFQAHLRRRSSIEEQMAQHQQQQQRRRRRSSVLSSLRLSDDHGRVTSWEQEYHGRITTRSVGCDGIVTIIPHNSQQQRHQRRNSTNTAFVSQLERARWQQSRQSSLPPSSCQQQQQ